MHAIGEESGFGDAAAGAIPVHRHDRAYAALVLAGGYIEKGPDGCWRCETGDLVLHPSFHLHGDTIMPAGSRWLNVPLPATDAGHRCRVLQLTDPGRLARNVLRDPGALTEAIAGATEKPQMSIGDWRDAFAQELAARPTQPVSRLARDFGVSAAHVSRAFRDAFGIGPRAFCTEHKLRAALTALTSTAQSLADVAHGCGFADQAHMTRAVAAATGVSPGRLRTAEL